MAAPELPTSRAETEWLSIVKGAIPGLKEVLGEIPLEYRGAAFERLFEVVLSDARGTPPLARAVSPPATAAAPGSPAPNGDRFGKFLADYGISQPALGQILDLESKSVLARNLAPTKAESQRRIAALLAVANAYSGGDFVVSREQLVEACKGHAVYDAANFAGHMSQHVHEGSLVFLRDPNGGYKVSRPGEAYLAAVVKGLLPSLSP